MSACVSLEPGNAIEHHNQLKAGAGWGLPPPPEHKDRDTSMKMVKHRWILLRCLATYQILVL